MKPALAWAGAVLALGLAVPAAAQTPAPPTARAPDVRMTVEAFTGILGPGDGVSARVRVANGSHRTAEGLRVLVTVHRKAYHRSDFQQAVDEGRVGNLWTSFDAEIDPIPGRQTRVVQLTRDAQELGFAQPADKFGVYPVRIQLQLRGEVAREVFTSIVLAPEEVEEPLRTALVLRVDAEPTLDVDGAHDSTRLREALAPRGRLQRMTDAAGAAPVLTLAPNTRLLEQLTEIAADPQDPLHTQATALLRKLQGLAARAGVEVVASPYGPGDLVALTRHGMRDEATRLIEEGRDRLEGLLGTAPHRRVLVPANGLDPASLAAAIRTGARTVVLTERYLNIPNVRELPSSPSPVRRLATDSGPQVTALVPDPWLSPLLEDGLDEALPGPLAAQRVIAETAVLYFERPFAEDSRGVLLAPPLLWDPSPDFASALFAGLHRAPWLQPVSLEGLSSDVAPEDAVARVSYPSSARVEELTGEYVAALRSARRALGSLDGVLADGSDTPSRFDRMLLTAAAVHYRERPAAGRALIRSVTESVAQLYDAVELPEGPSVLLSGIEGQVPITVTSTADVPLRVRLRLETPRYEFEGGPVRELTLEPASTRTLAFRARALAPGGTSPIAVVVEDLDGELELTRGTVVVRSTAVSLTALAVTAAAALFLLAWWVRTLARRRAARRSPVLEHESVG